MSETSAVKPFRVLSLDGGGMRGLYSVVLLETLAEHFSKQRNSQELDIGKGFDLIVGTSTGGILASGLAYGLPLKDIRSFYRNNGPSIFSNPAPDPSNLLSFLPWIIRFFNKPANDSTPLRNILKSLFGETTLKSLYDKREIGVCVSSVSMLKETSRVFKTPHNPKKQLDNDFSLVDICLATSAAPIIFPLSSITAPSDSERYEVFADGGLWANNPIMIGLIEALELTPPDIPIEIISIGTCPAPIGNVIGKEDVDMGISQWRVGVRTLSVSMNAQSSGAGYMAELLQGQLLKLGKKVNVLRLSSPAPSPEQIKFLQMDLASKEALQVLSQLGHSDGISAIRLSNDSTDPKGKMLHGIFNSMPELKIN